jgi:hypothetical protein
MNGGIMSGRGRNGEEGKETEENVMKRNAM